MRTRTLGEMMPLPSDEKLAKEQVKGAVRLLLVTLVLSVLYLVMPLQTEFAWLGLVVGLAALVCIAPFAVKRAKAIGNSRFPMLAAGEAVLMVVAMLVFGFSSVYLAVNRDVGQFEGLETRVDALYFTVTTLSTVGYGDVHATGQSARLLVTLQILFDLSLLAVSVRLLLGAARQGRTPTV